MLRDIDPDQVFFPGEHLFAWNLPGIEIQGKLEGAVRLLHLTEETDQATLHRSTLVLTPTDGAFKCVEQLVAFPTSQAVHRPGLNHRLQCAFRHLLRIDSRAEVRQRPESPSFFAHTHNLPGRAIADTFDSKQT